MIVTIDGPSGTGKSTIARLLANKLQLPFFDTGALYRALAWWIIENKIPQDELTSSLDRFDFYVLEEKGGKEYFVCGVNVTKAIRQKDIAEMASKFAAIKEVRAALLPIQRDYAHKYGAVCEGRDLGTVVFPEAEVKIFLTARVDIRAERRFKEMVEKDPLLHWDKQDILEALEKRDAQDSGRDIAPLKCPEDAFVLDTSELSIDQVVETLHQYIQNKENA